MTLIELLNKLPKDEIDRLYDEKITNKSKKITNKNKIKKLSENIITAFMFESMTMTSEEEGQLKAILRGKDIKKISTNLLDNGFVFKIDNKYLISDEIKELCGVFDDPDARESKYRLVISFYVEYNGAIPIDKLLNVVKESGLSITKKELIKYIKADNFVIDNNVVYVDNDLKKTDILEFKINDYQSYSIKEIVLINIFVEDSAKKIAKFLKKYTKESDKISMRIVNAIIMGFNYQDNVKEILSYANIKMPKEERKQFDSFIDKVSENIPTWELSGLRLSDLNKKIYNDNLTSDDITSFEETKEEKLDNYIYTYIMINGIIPIDKLLTLLNEEHEYNITKKKLIKKISTFEELKITDDIVAFDNMEQEDVNYLITFKKMLPKYKVIDDLDKFTLDEEENTFELDMLCNDYELSEEVNYALSSVIHFGVFDELMANEILKDYHVKLNNNDKKAVYKALKEIFNNTRLWTLNGFKKCELSQASTSNKIGRNDKCPCGSGKKYKHCCGK